MKKNISKLGKVLSKNEQQKINGGTRGIVPCRNFRDCWHLGEIGDYFCVEVRRIRQCVLY